MRVYSRKVYAVAVTTAVLALVACKQETQVATNEAANQTRAATRDVYVYGLPLVLMDVTRAKMTNVPNAASGLAAPMNQMVNARVFPDDTFVDVVSPNADTLYSPAWLNLRDGPMVLSVPDTHGRFYLFQMMDGWTNTFASPGKRTTGTGRENFAITGPGWSGAVPVGMKEIKSPTEMVWILGRTQTNGKADYAAVHTIQDQYRLTPLSGWGKPYTPPANVPVDPKVDMKAAPVDTVAAMDAPTFLSRLAMLLRDNPPAAGDGPMVAKMASIGVVPGQAFDLNRNGSEEAKAISDGVDDGKKRVLELVRNSGSFSPVNGWMIATGDMGTYGTNYDQRAAVAVVGLGANLKEDAFYPMARTDSEGRPLNGANRYVIHFDKGKTPPVNAFWSLTMYNAKQAFVSNPIKRFAIGDRDKLKLNKDGSLDIYVQHDSPGPDKESNWLPADAGNFNLIMRMYWPKESVLSGEWAPPGITKV